MVNIIQNITFYFLFLSLNMAFAQTPDANANPEYPQAEQPAEQTVPQASFGFGIVFGFIANQDIHHSSGGQEDWKGEPASELGIEGYIGEQNERVFINTGISRFHFTDKYKNLNFTGHNLYMTLNYKLCEVKFYKIFERTFFVPGVGFASGSYIVENRQTWEKDTYDFGGLKGQLGLLHHSEFDWSVFITGAYLLGDRYKGSELRAAIAFGL